jgi:hypothetical protein
MASWQGWILMPVIEVDNASPVVQFVGATMQEYDDLEDARRHGDVEAVSQVIRAAPVGLYERAVDSLGDDPMGMAKFPKLEAMHEAQKQFRNTEVRLADDGIRGRAHPDWIAASGAWHKALSEVKGFCRRPAEPTPDAQHAQHEKIFPMGRDGINQDTIDIAIDIHDQHETKDRQQIAREHFSDFEDCHARASKALKDIRARESKGRIVLPDKSATRNKRNGESQQR